MNGMSIVSAPYFLFAFRHRKKPSEKNGAVKGKLEVGFFEHALIQKILHTKNTGETPE